MGRVVRRTAQRRLDRTVLWNGNLEPPTSTFFTDHDHIVRWAWRTHHENAERVAAAVALRQNLVVVRLHGQREVDHWVAGPLSHWSAGQPRRRQRLIPEAQVVP